MFAIQCELAGLNVIAGKQGRQRGGGSDAGKKRGGRRAACNKTGVSLSPFDAIWQEIAADGIIAEPEREVSRHLTLIR